MNAPQPIVPDRARVTSPLVEIDVLIRARYPILYVSTWEEERLEQALQQIASARKKQLQVWTVTQGLTKPGSASGGVKAAGNNTTDPLLALDAVLQQLEPTIYLFKDFHRFTSDERCNLAVIRKLRDVAAQLRDSYKTLVLCCPLVRIAPELAKDVTLVDFALPDSHDFGKLLDRILDEVRDNPKIKIDLDSEGREKLLGAASGLTLREAENVFAKTLVADNRLASDDVQIVFSEKRQIIQKDGLLEFYDRQANFADVAGLENLKAWLQKRSVAFSKKAKQFGLPAPRGVLLLGVQGCGKSLTAKAAANLLDLPLLRFDLGRMFSGLVGSSEENIRRALAIAESIAPAVLWIDEIDKALAGTGGGGHSDGGTGARVLGTLLTWLSEKTSPVFTIATANDIRQLPAELLRKGRLDEIFFVDLPNDDERRQIFEIHLAKRGRDPAAFDLDALSTASAGFSGAEIEEAIVSALFDAFSDGSPLDTATIASAIAATVPLSKTMNEELTRLRAWASGRARPATASTSSQNQPGLRRKLELT